MNNNKNNNNNAVPDFGLNDYQMYNQLTMEELTHACTLIHSNITDPTYNVGLPECHETDYSYERRPQVNIGKKKYYCIVVMRLLADREKWGDDVRIKQGHDTSHFYCHNPNCVNPDHAHFEDHRVNKSRLCCRIYGHDPFNYPCPHVPQCHICDKTRIKM